MIAVTFSFSAKEIMTMSGHQFRFWIARASWYHDEQAKAARRKR